MLSGLIHPQKVIHHLLSDLFRSRDLWFRKLDLPSHMRPPKAVFPVWVIDSGNLGEGLIASAAGQSHYVIGPSREKTLDEYRSFSPRLASGGFDYNEGRHDCF